MKDIMTEYNKLIRDRIPEIIRESGGDCEVFSVSGDCLYDYLDKKLDEEIAEFRESRSPEEIADVLEVLFALAREKGVSEGELMRIRDEKREKRGGFEKGLVLVRSR